MTCQLYNVDVEYNRKGDRQKKAVPKEMSGEKRIVSDLILHKRGQSSGQDNLIALEMKKAYRSKGDKDKDRYRLAVMTEAIGDSTSQYAYGYVLGVYYEIGRDRKHVLIEYYQNGKLIDITDDVIDIEEDELL